MMAFVEQKPDKPPTTDWLVQWYSKNLASYRCLDLREAAER